MSTITSYTLAPMQSSTCASPSGANHVYTVHQATLSSKKILIFHTKGEEVKAILGLKKQRQSQQVHGHRHSIPRHRVSLVTPNIYTFWVLLLIYSASKISLYNRVLECNHSYYNWRTFATSTTWRLHPKVHVTKF